MTTEATRIPDTHLRKPCPDSPSYRTQGSQVEQWVPGQGWVDITPGAPTYEWGEGPDVDHVVLRDGSEASARHMQRHRHDYGTPSILYRRTPGQPWEEVQ